MATKQLSSKQISRPAPGVPEKLAEIAVIMSRHKPDGRGNALQNGYRWITETENPFPIGVEAKKTWFCGVADTATAHRDILYWSVGNPVYGVWPMKGWLIKAHAVDGARGFLVVAFGGPMTPKHVYWGAIVETETFVREALFLHLVTPIDLVEVGGRLAVELVSTIDKLLIGHNLAPTVPMERPDLFPQGD